MLLSEGLSSWFLPSLSVSDDVCCISTIFRFGSAHRLLNESEEFFRCAITVRAPIIDLLDSPDKSSREEVSFAVLAGSPGRSRRFRLL